MSRLGLYLLGLLSVADILTIALFLDGGLETAVALFGVLLGVVSLVLVVRALRDPGAAIRWLVGLRLVSAVFAVPVFFDEEAPAIAPPLTVAFILLTVVALALVRHRLRQ